MKAWAITFTPEMLAALQAGRKTVTRRIVRDQPEEVEGDVLSWGENSRTVAVQCPYAVPELLVKERLVNLGGLVAYRSDEVLALRDGEPVVWEWQHSTLPARYMPRWAARTRLVDIQASIEQLGDISEADAWAEGIQGRGVTRYEQEGRDLYRALWEKVHGEKSWIPFLWVWRLQFRAEAIAEVRAAELASAAVL